jgi:hypothetical protein
MAGLVLAIHVFRVAQRAIAGGRQRLRSNRESPHRAGKDMDARDKPGHDGEESANVRIP